MAFLSASQMNGRLLSNLPADSDFAYIVHRCKDCPVVFQADSHSTGPPESCCLCECRWFVTCLVRICHPTSLSVCPTTIPRRLLKIKWGHAVYLLVVTLLDSASMDQYLTEDSKEEKIPSKARNQIFENSHSVKNVLT